MRQLALLLMCSIPLVGCSDQTVSYQGYPMELKVHERDFTLHNRYSGMKRRRGDVTLKPTLYSGVLGVEHVSSSQNYTLNVEVQNIGPSSGRTISEPILLSSLDLQLNRSIRDFLEGKTATTEVSAKKNGSRYDIHGSKDESIEHSGPHREIEDCSINMPEKDGNHPPYQMEFGGTYSSKSVRRVVYTLEIKHHALILEFREPSTQRGELGLLMATLTADRPDHYKHYESLEECKPRLISDLIQFEQGD